MGDAAARQAVQTQIRKLLHQIHELELSLTEGPANIQDVTSERLVEYAKSLEVLHSLSSQLPPDRIPVDLLSYMDAGGNPDMYTANLFRTCVRDNELAKGKVVAMAKLEESVLAEAAAAFPDVAAEYRAAIAAAEAGQGGSAGATAARSSGPSTAK